MERKDYHVHTTFSDGQNTPEEMVRAAIQKGVSEIGFSDHAYTFFDESYCMPKKKIPAYRAEIAALKEKYREKITVLCGIEQDYYSDMPTDSYDYVIGSVHYIKVQEHYIPVDETADILQSAALDFFHGDIYALVEEYYRTVADVVRKTGADLIGHFDLIAKFNEKQPLFDEQDPRYTAAWKAAADALLKTGKPFEKNTSAILRGYRKTPYPSAEMQNYIKKRGGRFVLSSDSHSEDTLCFGFDRFSV